jgi:protein dithiol:quinone oxidoreductase
MNQPRLPFVLILLATSGLLAFGLYLQHAEGLEPCPLCVFQRLCFIAVAVIALVASIHGPSGWLRRVYAADIALVSVVGAGIAGRQVWLQHLPADRVPECGPGLEFMLDTSPLLDVIATVLKGSGDCAVVDWTFLGFSIAEWSLACFVGLTLFAGYLLFFPQRPHYRLK